MPLSPQDFRSLLVEAVRIDEVVIEESVQYQDLLVGVVPTVSFLQTDLLVV